MKRVESVIPWMATVLASPTFGRRAHQEVEESSGILMASKTLSMAVDAVPGAYIV